MIEEAIPYLLAGMSGVAAVLVLQKMYGQYVARELPEFGEAIEYIAEYPPDGDVAGWDGPGWYFWDESYHLHGPYLTFDTADRPRANLFQRCSWLK